MIETKSSNFLTKCALSPLLQFVPLGLFGAFFVVQFALGTSLQKGWLLLGGAFIAVGLLLSAIVFSILVWAIKKYKSNPYLMVINIVLVFVNVLIVVLIPRLV